MHKGVGVRGGLRGGWIKVFPPSKFFAKLVNKNAIKHQKGAPCPKFFTTTYIPYLPKFLKKPHGPPPPPLDFQTVCIYEPTISR